MAIRSYILYDFAMQSGCQYLSDWIEQCQTIFRNKHWIYAFASIYKVRLNPKCKGFHFISPICQSFNHIIIYIWYNFNAAITKTKYGLQTFPKKEKKKAYKMLPAILFFPVRDQLKIIGWPLGRQLVIRRGSRLQYIGAFGSKSICKPSCWNQLYDVKYFEPFCYNLWSLKFLNSLFGSPEK